MNISQRGLALIKQFEGISLKPYLCPAGIPTIGYGSTMYADGRQVTLKDPAITQKAAEELLAALVARPQWVVTNYVDVPMTQGQFDALVSFVYNVGATAFINSTLRQKLKAKDYLGAAEQFVLWNKATVNGVKVALPGLTNRRLAEKAVFQS